MRERVCCAALLIASACLAQQSGTLTVSPAALPIATSQIEVECLPASRASAIVGEHGCVAGRVSRVTFQKNGSTHLSLCPPKSDCSFHVVVHKRDLPTVGDLAYLRGKRVALIGDVRNYRGHPQMVLTSREQVQVIADNPRAEFDSAKPLGRAQSAKRNRAW